MLGENLVVFNVNQQTSVIMLALIYHNLSLSASYGLCSTEITLEIRQPRLGMEK